MHSLDTVAHAIEEWMGSKADAKIEFGHANAEEGPSELWVIFFFPTGPQSGSDMTWAFTVGLSRGIAPGETRAGELFFLVKGQLSTQDIDLTAKQLADLAVLPYRQGSFFEIDMVFQESTIHPFSRMTNLLITNWDPQGTSLPGLTDPEVDLLWVVPLFDPEAKRVAKGACTFATGLTTQPSRSACA